MSSPLFKGGYEKRAMRIFGVVVVTMLIAAIVFWVAVIGVIAHFVFKYW